MQTRTFGRTGWAVSAIGFGAWAIGADWGDVDDATAAAALHQALDEGMTFIDTADVYGDGRSERSIARVLKERGGSRPIVATKAGRRLPTQSVAGYTRDNLTQFVERSLRNLDVEALDLLQLHCPSTEVYYAPEVFGVLDDLKTAGKLRQYGVSVEKIEEAIKAIEFPGVASVQIIFNAFRQRPAELFFDLARRRGVAVIARVPLASGLLSGKFTRNSVFGANDHRQYNRAGAAFDVGETFSGVPFEAGLDAVEELRAWVPPGVTMAQFALRWILEFDAVSVAIPGAKNREQATANAAAAELPPLTPATVKAVADLYDRRIRPFVHQRW